jgi:hypothetical protein
MFKWQISLDRHGPRPLPNVCLLPDPPLFLISYHLKGLFLTILLLFTGLWIRINFLRIRIRIQSLMLVEANTDPDPNPDPDPIRIQGFNNQKLKKNYS